MPQIYTKSPQIQDDFQAGRSIITNFRFEPKFVKICDPFRLHSMICVNHLHTLFLMLSTSPTFRSHTMFATAFLTLAALFATRIAWWAVQRFVLKNPLDNLPGPESDSLLMGSRPRRVHTAPFYSLHYLRKL